MQTNPELADMVANAYIRAGYTISGGGFDGTRFSRKIDGSSKVGYNKKKGSVYDEFSTNAMIWANSSSTQKGDVIILNDKGKRFVLIEATYSTVVKYGNEKYPVFLNVGKAKNGDGYHIYDITKKIGKTAKQDALEWVDNDLHSEIDFPIDNKTIPQKNGSVNTQSMQKTENDSGERKTSLKMDEDILVQNAILKKANRLANEKIEALRSVGTTASKERLAKVAGELVDEFDFNWCL